MKQSIEKSAAKCQREERMTSEYIIKTQNVSKKFKKTYAVKDLSLSVRRNTVYGLLGPNGAGKSTLLKMITGIIRPTSGEIQFCGRPWKRKDLSVICGRSLLMLANTSETYLEVDIIPLKKQLKPQR